MAENTSIGTAHDAETSSAGTRTAGVASSIIFGRLLSFVFTGIAFIVVARLLGNSVYGIYTVAIALAGIFATDLGLGYTMNKFIGEYIGRKKSANINDIFSSGLAFALITGIVLTLIVFALSTALSVYALHSSLYTYVLQVASLTVLLQIVYGVLYQSLVGFGKRRLIAAVLVLQALLQAVVSIALAVAGAGAISPIIGAISGLLAGSMLAFALILRSGVSLQAPNMDRLRQVFRFSLPIGVSNLFISLAINLTPIVLGLFVLSGVVGNFGITSKTNTFIGVFAESIGIALLPMFASRMSTKEHRRDVSRIFNYSIYAS
ncbi:MAG: oligosaccharide flippase family protein, partial [Candidatus Micrarchaeaceae archaeon]